MQSGEIFNWRLMLISNQMVEMTKTMDRMGFGQHEAAPYRLLEEFELSHTER